VSSHCTSAEDKKSFLANLLHTTEETDPSIKQECQKLMAQPPPVPTLSLENVSFIRASPPEEQHLKDLWTAMNSTNISVFGGIFTSDEQKLLAKMIMGFNNKKVQNFCRATRSKETKEVVCQISDRQTQINISHVAAVFAGERKATSNATRLQKLKDEATEIFVQVCQMDVEAVIEKMMLMFRTLDDKHLRPGTEAMWSGASQLVHGCKLLINHPEGIGQDKHTDNMHPYMVQSFSFGIDHDDDGSNPVPSKKVASTRLCRMDMNVFKYADSSAPGFKPCYGHAWALKQLLLALDIDNAMSCLFPATLPHAGPGKSKVSCLRATMFQQRRPPGCTEDADAKVNGFDTQGYEPDYLISGILDPTNPEDRKRLQECIQSHQGGKREFMRRHTLDQQEAFQKWYA
jgi:hypothetical protein